jgi:heat shock protein HtpX
MEFWGRECVGKLVGGRDGMMLNADPATAHLFIVNPLSGQALGRLFSTHPPLEERIARLMAMKGQLG